jgi:hypothetical protein
MFPQEKFAMGGSIPGAVGFTYALTQSPAPSNGKYAKKTMASAQEGLNLGPIIKDNLYKRNFVDSDPVKQWTLDYINSPKYKERLTKSGYKNVPEEIKIRSGNVKNTKIEPIPNEAYEMKKMWDSGDFDTYSSNYNLDKNIIHLNEKNDALLHKDIYKNSKFILPKINETEAHEFGHAEVQRVDPTGENDFDFRLNKKDVDNLIKRGGRSKGINKHDQDPYENKADLNSFRYNLKQQGIYDAGNEEFTEEHLKKARKTFAKDRLLKNYSDKDLIWLMNNIAQNEQPDENINIAQNGQEMKFYQEGLDWQPKSISKNGGWLNKYDVAQNGVETWKKQLKLLEKENASKVNLKELLAKPVWKTKTFEQKLQEKLQEDKYKKVVKDNTNVRNYNNVDKHSNVARNKTDKEIADERKAVRKKSDANVLNQYSKKIFDTDNWTRQNLSDATLGLESKFRVSDKPNFFDEYLNPANMIGNMASNLGQAPLQAEQTDSYMPYVTSIAEPVVMGAFGELLSGIMPKVPVKKIVNKTKKVLAKGALNTIEGVNDLAFKLGTKYRQSYPVLKKSIEAGNAGNAWTREWYSNPQIQNRYNEWINPANNFVTPKNAILESNILESIPGGGINLNKGYANRMSGTVARNNLEKLLTEGKFTDPSFSNFKNLSRGTVARFSHGMNDAFVNVTHPSFNRNRLFGKGYDVGNTFVHENTHAITKGDFGFKPEYLKRFKEPFARTAEDIAKKELTKHQKYLVKPTEVHARINEIRRTFGLSPETVVDDNMINDIIKKGLKGQTSVEKDFFKLIKDKAKFKELMNTAPAGAIGVGLGAAALNKQKDGGVIKDDMGQWAHPGEITEIGSNQITMQGVPYPVLGVSDTGDTQMMYPEEEYEFDGEKVTEYPIAQNGFDAKAFQKVLDEKFPRSWRKKKDINIRETNPVKKDNINVKKKNEIIIPTKKEKATRSIQDQKQYMKDWVDSPMYNEMVDNSTTGISDKFFLNLDRDINHDDITISMMNQNLPNDPNVGADSNSKTGLIRVFPEGYQGPQLEGMISHEISHTIDKPVNWGGIGGDIHKFLGDPYMNGKRAIPKKDIDLMQSYYKGNDSYTELFNNDALKNKELNKDRDWFNYVSKPTETRARLNDIRYNAKKYNIYDPFTEKVDVEKLNEIRKLTKKAGGFDPFDQLRDVYSEDQIINMLNTISQNDTKEDRSISMAKNGIRQEQKGLVNLDQLTNFTNYNKPQPGGWLNKYN